jgi:hypothetical protein
LTWRRRWLIVYGGCAAFDSSPPAKTIVNDRPKQLSLPNVHLSFESVKAHRLIIFLELPK